AQGTPTTARRHFASPRHIARATCTPRLEGWSSAGIRRATAREDEDRSAPERPSWVGSTRADLVVAHRAIIGLRDQADNLLRVPARDWAPASGRRDTVRKSVRKPA